MRKSRDIRQLSLGTLFLAVVFAVCSCQSARNDRFRSSFLPPASVPAVPEPAATTAIPEPPIVEPRLFIDHTPEVFRKTAAADLAPSPAEVLIRRAESHFQAGKVHYKAGKFDAARVEFDRAVEILLRAPEGTLDRPSLEGKLDELIESIHRYDISGLSTGDPEEEPGYDKPPMEDVPEPALPVDPTQKVRILERLRATVSELPLEVNDEVLRFIQYFSSGRGRKIYLAGLRRAGRYRPLIERILDEEGVPRELIHLAQAESGFHARAVSRKKATGMWQFMLSRGQEYGLQRTKITDDRLDPERATRAAARHLRDLYTEFGDWYLAIAAYNCGPGAVQRAVTRTGYADVWELRRRNVLPRETSSYVPIVLAMAIMATNPSEHDLEGLEADPPLEYDQLEISSATNLLLAADITERPVSDIRDLNPALLRSVAPPGYSLRVPRGTAAEVQAALETIPAGQRAAWRMHRVTNGDTLASIARRYRTSPGGISKANGIDADELASGSFLVIPARLQPESSGAAKKPVKRAGRKSKPGAKTVARSRKTPIRNTRTVASRGMPSQTARAMTR